MFGVYHGIGFDSGPVKFEPSPLLCLTVKDAELLRPGINYFNIGSSLYVSAARAWRRASLIRKDNHTFLLTGMKPVGAYHTAAASFEFRATYNSPEPRFIAACIAARKSTSSCSCSSSLGSESICSDQAAIALLICVR